MIQFNLLPDVKQEYVKARRTKQLVILISLGLGAVSLAIMLLMLLTVDVVQKKSLSDLNNDITTKSQQLKSVPDLDKILTVQNQLNTLTGLHDQKVVASRMFGYISQVTPDTVSISKLNVDFTANTIIIDGEAPSLDVVNKYTDTLKATAYFKDGDSNTSTKAFSNVVLSSFGRDTKGATYTINLSYKPDIFNNAASIKLTVPSITTGAQAQLFQKQEDQ